MKFLQKKITLLLLLIITFILGYIRETTFLIINTVLRNYPFPYNQSYTKPPDFLYELSNNTLIIIKWAFTFAFSFMFMSLAILICRIYFNNKQYTKILIVSYSLLFFVAFLISVIGYLLNNFNSFHTISRAIVGMLQSPVPVITVFIVFYLAQHHKEKYK